MMNKSGQNGLLMSHIMENSLVEYLMDEVRNICLHFEAYKDFEPLRNYLFGKGWRILKLLCHIKSFVTEEKSTRKEGAGRSTSKNVPLCSQPDQMAHFRDEKWNTKIESFGQPCNIIDRLQYIYKEKEHEEGT